MIGFIIGLLLGSFVGVGVVCCLVVGGDGDDD